MPLLDRLIPGETLSNDTVAIPITVVLMLMSRLNSAPSPSTFILPLRCMGVGPHAVPKPPPRPPSFATSRLFLIRQVTAPSLVPLFATLWSHQNHFLGHSRLPAITSIPSNVQHVLLGAVSTYLHPTTEVHGCPRPHAVPEPHPWPPRLPRHGALLGAPLRHIVVLTKPLPWSLLFARLWPVYLTLQLAKK